MIICHLLFDFIINVVGNTFFIPRYYPNKNFFLMIDILFFDKHNKQKNTTFQEELLWNPP
jgi:hypothetical protein